MNKDCLESDLDFVDYSDHVSSGLSTTRPISVPRRRVMSPPVDEVSSDFRPPLSPPVAGAPLSHSAGPLPRRRDTSHSALESAQYHNHPAAYSPCDRLYDNDGLEEYIEEPGLSGDNSVAHGPVISPFWAIGPWEEDWRRLEETLSRPVTARQRSFDEREKRKQLEKEEEKLRTEAEGGDYGRDETDGEEGEGEGEEEEERKGQEEEETGKREEHGAKRKQADDTRQGFQDWDPSGSYSQQNSFFPQLSDLHFCRLLRPHLLRWPIDDQTYICCSAAACATLR